MFRERERLRLRARALRLAHLRHAGADVRIHDAMVTASVPVEELVVDADCLLLLVDHHQYLDLDPLLLGGRMRRRIDTTASGF